MKKYIISLGGSLIFPGEINTNFLKKFRNLVVSYAKNGNRFVIICGGGQLNRQYNKALLSLRKATYDELDILGIKVTEMNAFFVRMMFGNNAEIGVLGNPTKKIRTSKRIIIGCGWKPGCSTDKDAVLAAKTYGAKTIINLTNVNYVYTKDPRKYKDAKLIKETTWKEFRKIVGNKWSPKLNAPFDPVASKMAQKLKLKVIIANGKNLKNLKNIIEGRKFRGTVIR